MRNSVILAAALVAAPLANADDYVWANNDHACIVENANYMHADGSGSGKWSNAPRTFFIKMTNCADFTNREGLVPGVDPNGGGEYSLSQARVNSCAEKAANATGSITIESYQVIEVDGFESGVFEPLWDLMITIFPLTTSIGEVFKYNRDGTLDIGTYSATDEDNSKPSWFTLRARCTVLRR